MYGLREWTNGYQWKRVGGRRMGFGDEHVHTPVFKMDYQQGPTV